MGNKSRTNYLASNVLIFTIGTIGTKLIVFFLVPLYTVVLNTGEFGTVDLITTISAIAVPIFTLNICESVMRFSLDKGSDSKKITQIGTYILILGSIAALIIIPICSMVNLLTQYSVLVYFYLITYASSQLFLYDLRGKELLKEFSFGSILQTFMIASLNILFLLYFKLGIYGYFLAYIVANLLTTVYAIFVGKSMKAFVIRKFDIPLTKDMVKYSVLLIPNSIMWWIINSSDRIMVTRMINIEANGIYAVSYKLPIMISTFSHIFNQAWSYSAIKEEGAVDESEYNNRVLKFLTSGAMLVGITITAITKPLLKIYVSESYYSAWKYVPFLAIGCTFMIIATFMATSYTVHKDSLGYLLSSSFAAIINIVLNLILIPVIGIYGAAMATGISYVAVFLFRLINTKKYIKYNLNIKEFWCGTIMLIIVSLLTYLDGIYVRIIEIIIVLFAIYFYSPQWMIILKPLLLKIISKVERDKRK